MACIEPTRFRLIKEIPLRVIAREAIADYHRKRALVERRDAIRCLAVANGHSLGLWRVHGDDCFALVECAACGEGAHLDLDTAKARLTEGLERTCPGMASRRFTSAEEGSGA